MPELPDVIPGEAVESAWGNQIRDRTVQRYADSTERDSLVPLPVPGDLAWLDDIGAITVFDGAAWWQVLDAEGGYTIGPGLVDLARTSSGMLRMTRTGTTPGQVGGMTIQISGDAVWFDVADAGGADPVTAMKLGRNLAPFEVPITAPPEAPVHLTNSGQEQVWYTKASGLVSIGIQTTLAQGSSIGGGIPVEIRPGLDSDVNATMNMYTSSGTAEEGTGVLRVRGVNGALFLAGVPAGYTPGSDVLRCTVTYVIGARGI